jgi:hypothetical protein
MILKHCLCVLTVLWLPATVQAKLGNAAVPLQIRAVLFDPAHSAGELFYPDKNGDVVKLDFRPQDLTPALLTLPVNGSLVLYDKANVDPKNPKASLAASVKLPPDIKRAIIVVVPEPAGSTPAYRMVLIDDSAKGFPKGESRVLSLVTMETTLEAGEHKLTIPPGGITRVPAITRVDEFNMSQTNFYYQQSGSWVPFTDRQLQFLAAYRRIFIIHATPGTLQPSVTTIVDTSPAVLPK